MHQPRDPARDARNHEIPPPPEVIAAVVAPGHPARPFDTGEQSEGDVQRSLRCLSDAVYYEARSESEDGQRAVAQVVLNRVRHPAFPSSVCGVVYQGSARRTGCQFSFTCDGSLGRRLDPASWSRAHRIAEEALAGQVYAPVGLATHYHTTAIRPWWAASLARAVTVGSHIFYRWRGEWGNPKAFRQPYSGQEQGSAYAVGSNLRDEAKVQIAAFGVTIHRASTGHRASTDPDQGSAATVKIHRSASSSGVRIQVGVPADVEGAGTAVAIADDRAEPIPVS